MNWSKAKSILIVFLICLNLFLLVNVLSIEREKGFLGEEMIKNASSVLESMGISIAPELVPNRYYRLSTIHFDDLDTMRQAIASKLLGSSYSTTKSEIPGEVTFATADANISFDQTQRLEYRLTSTTVYEISQTSEQENTRLIQAMLQKLGIKPKNYMIHPPRNANGFTYTAVSQYINGIPLYDCQINISVTGGVLVEMSGNIVLGEGRAEAIVDAKDAVNVLFTVAEDSTVPPGKILFMELGYIAGDDRKQNILSLFPAWKIVTEHGNTYYYDTVTGNTQQENTTFSLSK